MTLDPKLVFVTLWITWMPAVVIVLAVSFIVFLCQTLKQ
jgi:hypothetical protein